MVPWVAILSTLVGFSHSATQTLQATTKKPTGHDSKGEAKTTHKFRTTKKTTIKPLLKVTRSISVHLGGFRDLYSWRCSASTGGGVWFFKPKIYVVFSCSSKRDDQSTCRMWQCSHLSSEVVGLVRLTETSFKEILFNWFLLMKLSSSPKLV